MPIISLPITDDGPMIDIVIGPSRPRQDALVAAGRKVPPFVGARLLIDTGASATTIDPDVLAPIGLVPTGRVRVQTPSTGADEFYCAAFDISLRIVATRGAPMIVEALPIVETDLRSQGLDGLLGRDVLDQCILIYNAPQGSYTLTY